MPTKPIDQLLFAQGGLCFFCQHTLKPADASVEHLVARANGGSNDPDNTVACCKALNALLGSMSLKEKLRVVLNQKGAFRCPKGNVAEAPKSTHKGNVADVPKSTHKGNVADVPKSAQNQTAAQRLALVVENLHKRGTALPRTVETLSSTISAILQNKLTKQEVAALVGKLKAQGIISVDGTKVSYALPPRVA